MMIHMDIGHPGAKFSGHMNSSMIEQWNFLEPLCIPTILFLNFPFPKQIGIKACVICQHLSVFCGIYIYLPESSHVFNWLGFSQILPKIGRVRSVLLQSVQKIYFDKAMHLGCVPLSIICFKEVRTIKCYTCSLVSPSVVVVSLKEVAQRKCHLMVSKLCK